nr:reverse transcriptase domain-containing protein [Tanacetum cinerariifolium]
MPQRWLSATKIDWKVESLYGYPFKCFLDAYKGYHQIKMAKEDEEKTTFITSHGILYYSKMLFGLKNAEATYQRLVYKTFQKQIGQNLEVYVDDLVIKSHTEKEVIRNIEETFKTLREINMKLNPKKCTIGMREGVFLGYKVNFDGLKVCRDKVEAILSFSSPKCLKDVQKLNGKLASLNRFLSKSAEKSLPFFKTLKKFKGQILADFIVERPEDDPPDTPMEDKEEPPDSTYIAKEPGMIKYLEKVKNRTNTFKEFSIKQVPRGENKNADALSKTTSTSFAHLSKQVLVEELKENSIDEKEVLVVVEEEGCTWMTPIYEYHGERKTRKV